jgi:DNA integrity scanning protein DisA with diadenylate cyclase activity
MEVPEAVVRAGVRLAENIRARAILVFTETGDSLELVLKHNRDKLPLIVATPRESTFQHFLSLREKANIIKLITRRASRAAQVEDAVAMSASMGLLREGDLVVAIGSSFEREADSVIVYDVKKDVLDRSLYAFLRKINVKLEVFKAALGIALEIGREGRGGRPIGTAFLIGDSEKIMENSKQLILNPFEGQVLGERLITSRELRESIKELAQLDGAFVVSGDGVIEAAGRYLTVEARGVGIPRGLGARHAAVAAMTAVTDSIGITVSQSGGIVRVFKKGEVIMTIEPQRRIVFREELK